MRRTDFKAREPLTYTFRFIIERLEEDGLLPH